MADISIVSTADSVNATGASYQQLARLEIKNSDEAELTVGGTEEDLAELFGVSIEDIQTDNEMSTVLQFLYTEESGRRRQFDLENEDADLAPGESALIDVRLVNAPGSTGSFKIKCGDTEKQISIV